MTAPSGGDPGRGGPGRGGPGRGAGGPVRVDEALRRVALGIGRARPEGFVAALLEHVADAIGVDLAFLARDVAARPGWGTFMGLWWRPTRELLPPFSYVMAGTPCGSGEVCIPEEAQTHYPRAQLLAELGVESFVLVPLLDRTGAEVGHLGAMHTEPLADPDQTLTLLRLLATLAAAELDREEAIARLQESERRLQEFLDHAPFGVYLYEQRPGGRVEIIGVNPAADRMAAVQGQEQVGKTMLEAFPYVAHTALPSLLERAIAGEGPFLVPELQLDVEGRRWVLELHLFHTGPDRGAVLFYDLSARAHAEGALRESEERLHKVLEHAPFGAYYFALDDEDRPVLVGANAAADRIMGIDNRRFLGQLMVEAFPALRETDLPRRSREVARGERGPLYEPRVPYDEGGISGVFEVHGFRVGPRRMAFLFRDVTAQARAEEAERAAARLEASATLAGGIAHDVNNLMTGILGHVALLEREPDEARDQRLQQIARAAQRATGLAHQLLSYARGGKYDVRPTDVNALVQEVLRRQRASLPTAVRIEARLTEDLARIDADRTQLRQLVRALVSNAVEASAERESPPTPIVVATDSVFLDEEQAAALQVERGDFVLLRVRDRGPGMDEGVRERVFEPYFSTKAPGRGMGLAAAYGVVRNHGGAIRVDSAPGAGATFEVLLPVRESHGTFSAQALTGEPAERDWSAPGSPERVGHLALGIAHDLNNLLAVALGALAGAEARVQPPGDAEAPLRQALLGCRELAYRLLTLGGLGEEREPVDVGAVAADVARLVRTLLPAHVELRLELPDALPPVSGVRARLENALLNLCLNSRDALAEGGGAVVVAAGRLEEESEEQVFLRVSDDGCGMTEQVRARSTEPFFSTKPAHQGAGLGLALVARVVRDHGGELRIASRPAQGTEITVLLPPLVGGPEPVDRAHGRGAPASSQEPGRSSDLPARGRVLVVDDQEHVSRSTARMLELEGYLVEVARSGEEALQRVEEAARPFDAVLLDLVLPGMGGAEVLRRIRARRPEQPVVVCSGFGSAAEVRGLLRHGAAFLAKPFLYEELMTKLREVRGSDRPAPARASDPGRDDETRPMHRDPTRGEGRHGDAPT